jgi:hypothetical protein
MTSADTRCVVIVDEALPLGPAANAVGVLAVTLGATLPALVGADLVDADGQRHPGLIPHGLAVLRAPQTDLADLRLRAQAAGIGVIDFPTAGQETTDYEDLRRRVAELATAEVAYLGLALHGPRRRVNKLTGSLALLK